MLGAPWKFRIFRSAAGWNSQNDGVGSALGWPWDGVAAGCGDGMIWYVNNVAPWKIGILMYFG